MKIDNLEQYISVREALIKEKAELEARLARIHEALGEPLPSSQGFEKQTSQLTGNSPRRGRPPVGGGQSLREVVAGVLQGSGPLSKQEVLDRVLRTGYKFTTTNPLNSLGVILYGKGNGFVRQNGQFTLGGTQKTNKNSNGSYTNGSYTNGSSSITTDSASAEKGTRGRGPRKMSEEAKARIAAAARQRWKKAKAEGKSRL